MDQAVTPKLISEFERDGVVILRGVLSSEWTGRLAAAVDRELANPGPYSRKVGASQRYHTAKLSWRTDRDIAAYVKDSPLPAIAAALLRSHKVNFLLDQLFLKDAESPDAETPWHHDQVVFPVAGTQTVSFWTSLDPVTADSGALEFIRGSHRWGRLFQPNGFDGKPLFGIVESYEPVTPDFDAQRDKYEFVQWDMQPGDIVAFSFLTLHASHGNRSNVRRRRAYTIRYTGDDVLYCPNAASQKELLVNDLVPGAPLDSREFPVVWRAA